MESLWEKTAEHTGRDALRGDVKTDVLVIGGGMAGILCAHMLSRAGIGCVLAEARTLLSGVTKGTTAKITSQHGLIYGKIARRFGADAARQYYDANESALGNYRELCRGIDCDFEEKDAYVYSRTDARKIENELTVLRSIGVDADMLQSLPLPFGMAGAVRFRRQAQFHPLKFAHAVSRGLNVYEHTAVRELVGTTALTDHGRIKADKIIVCTHFPFINKHGSYFLKLYQYRSYVIALDGAPPIDGMYVDEAETGMSFREADGLLLLGGGGHRTGKPGGNWRELREFAARAYPRATEKYAWATQDCMSLDGLPYIGRYSPRTEGLYVAAGFNKWGMTSSMTAATLLCDLVRGKNNAYASLFDPSRTVLRPQLAINGWEAVSNLLTPSSHRCPHLGCALKWNAAEHTWDCACHGSRFASDGKLIDNPATGDLKK